MKWIGLFLLQVLASGVSFGQSRKIVARVLSAEEKKPVKNANIVILGTTKGAVTNHLGFFSVEFGEDDPKTLVISHVGYLTSKIDLPESSNFVVHLEREYLEISPFDIGYFKYLFSEKELVDPAISDSSRSSKIGDFSMVELDAEYPGEWDYFFRDLGSMVIKDSVLRPGMDSLIIKFEVDASGGSIVESISRDSLSLSNYVVNLFSRLQKWRPAEQRGVSVSQYFTLPLKWREEAFEIVEEPARPKEGMNKFYQFIGSNLRYPSKARSARIGGRVFVEFVIDEEGKITDPRAIMGIGYGCDEEAVRVLAMAPNWEPGIAKGKPVKQRMVLPITFSMTGERTITAKRIMDTSSDDFYQYMRKNIRYPATARQKGVEGWVELRFGLNSSRSGVVNASIVRDIGAECGQETLNVLRATPSDILKSVITPKSSYTLLVGFGLGNEVQSDFNITPNDSIEILKPIQVVAVGIERERLVAGSRNYGSGSKNLKPTSVIPPIDNNIHKSFETAFMSRKKVEAISIVRRDIAMIPENIGKLTSIRFMDLESNRIETLPKQIGDLNKLEELYLRNNRVKELPVEINRLTSLRILGLANNQLSQFPSQIIELNFLKALDLSGNGIKAIPKEIGRMSNLRILYLVNNEIESLPDEFFELSNLSQLYINGNKLNNETIDRLKKKFPKTKIIYE